MSDHPILALKRQGLSLKQIAAKLGLPVGTVTGRYYAALKELENQPKPIAGTKLSRGQTAALHRSSWVNDQPVTIRRFSWEGRDA